MSSETLRRAAALMRKRAEVHKRTMRETSPEVHGGPDAHWSPVFLSSAILAHPHVLDDDPEVVRVVGANVEAMAPWADSRISLAVADLLNVWVDNDLLGSPFTLPEEAACITDIARAYLGESA